jgi:hypothetical protein
MTDADDLRDPDPSETRHVLRQVAVYRDLRNSVRKKSTGNLIFGGIMLAVWYFGIPDPMKFGPFGLVYLALAMLEFCVGLLNRLWPTAEGILLDGLVLLAFGLWNIARPALIWLKVINGRIDPVFALFGLFWLYQGVQTVRSYFQLRASLPARPTAAHLRWFDDLVKELRHADPRDDASALALPTDPFLTAKLLGDNAFFLDPNGHVIITARELVTLERVEADDPERPPRGYLSVEGAEYLPFKLSEANWSNYVAWKREGGEDPLATPPTVSPVR